MNRLVGYQRLKTTVGRNPLCRILNRSWSKFWVKLIVLGAFISLQSAYLLSFQLTFSTSAFLGDKRTVRRISRSVMVDSDGAIVDILRRNHVTSLPTSVAVQGREEVDDAKLKGLVVPIPDSKAPEVRNSAKLDSIAEGIIGNVRAKIRPPDADKHVEDDDAAADDADADEEEDEGAEGEEDGEDPVDEDDEEEEEEEKEEEEKKEEEGEKVKEDKHGHGVMRIFKKRAVVGPILDVNPNTTIPDFLRKYEAYCELAYLPFIPDDKSLPPCECVSGDLEGRLNLSFTGPSLPVLSEEHHELELGGHWKPPDCVAMQRVAIIVPYRNREPHLRAFLKHMHPLLQRQLLDYRIIVVEQIRGQFNPQVVAPSIFNKATMMNIGFTEAKKIDKFDCFVFHDVDVLAEDDRNFYTCAHQPRHVGAFLKRFAYKLKYMELFGAATAFTANQFETLNGFSNDFFGWGGEDDDMGRRVDVKGYERLRFPQKIARYTMISHARDAANPYNKGGKRGSRYRPRHYAKDGLINLKYNLVAISYKRLFTHITAEIAGPKVQVDLSVQWPKWKGQLDGVPSDNNDEAAAKANDNPLAKS